MSIVLALTNDLAALLAMNEAISTRRQEVRRWAWAVLVLAGGTAAGLNTWHAKVVGMVSTCVQCRAYCRSEADDEPPGPRATVSR